MAQGSQGELAYKEGAGDVDFSTGSPVGIEFQSESLSKIQQVIDTSGIRGTRKRLSTRQVDGTSIVQGDIAFYPTPTILQDWLKFILGGTVTADTDSAGAQVGVDRFDTGETVTEFAVIVDRVATHTVNTHPTFEYRDLKVNRATFSAAVNQPVLLTVNLIGKTGTASDEAMPSLTYGTAITDDPYVFHQSVVTLQGWTDGGGGNPNIEDFSLTIDNALEAQFYNSQTAQTIDETDRIITLSFTTPWLTQAFDDLYDSTPGTGDIRFTNTVGASTTYLEFLFDHLERVERDPVISGRGEIKYPLTYQALDAGNYDIRAHNDHTA